MIYFPLIDKQFKSHNNFSFRYTGYYFVNFCLQFLVVPYKRNNNLRPPQREMTFFFVTFKNNNIIYTLCMGAWQSCYRLNGSLSKELSLYFDIYIYIYIYVQHATQHNHQQYLYLLRNWFNPLLPEFFSSFFFSDIAKDRLFSSTDS